MPRSQLSVTLDPAEQSHLYSAIAKHINTSLAHRKTLRTEITYIVHQILNILESQGLEPSSKRRRRVNPAYLDDIVQHVVRRRIHYLERLEKKERVIVRRRERWKKEAVKELYDYMEDKNSMGGYGVMYGPSRYWQWYWPTPIPCGRPMRWYYAPYGFERYEWYKPPYVMGVPRTVKEEEKRRALERKKKRMEEKQMMEKRMRYMKRYMKRYNVENLHVYV